MGNKQSRILVFEDNQDNLEAIKTMIINSFPDALVKESTSEPEKLHLATLNLLEDLHCEINARKSNEEELKKSEAILEDIFQTVSEGIAYISPEGIILAVNSALEKIAQTSKEFMVGRNILDVNDELLLPETAVAINRIMKKIIDGKNDELFTLENNGKVLEITSRINRTTHHFTGLVRDITEKKKIESTMIQSERLMALGEMSAGMAHEINQPLNTLSIALDNILLEARTSHSVSEEYLISKSEKIFNNILRIKNIIDHVRDFSRKQDPVYQSLFYIHNSITDAISMVSEQFKMTGIEVVTRFDDQTPMIKGNTYKFEQVILNLLINSKDALLEKKNRLKHLYPMSIHIKTHFNKMRILIEVEDNGCGIEEKHLDKVLQPFYTTKETGKGTGLGLSVTYGLIQELKGRIDISSKVMTGTIVTITLPVLSKNLEKSQYDVKL